MVLLVLGLYVLAALLLGTVALGGLVHLLIAAAVLAACLIGLAAPVRGARRAGPPPGPRGGTAWRIPAPRRAADGRDLAGPWPK